MGASFPHDVVPSEGDEGAFALPTLGGPFWADALGEASTSSDTAPELDAFLDDVSGSFADMADDGAAISQPYTRTGGKWGSSSVAGTSGGVVTWSIAGAGLKNASGDPTWFTGSTVDLSTFLSFDYAAVLRQAFNAWSSVANIDFVQVADGGGDMGAGPTAMIRISGGYIDGRPSSGSSVLASAWSPPTNGTAQAGPLNGDIDFDSGEGSFWTASSFLAVATHEIGHALGLGHTSVGASLMNPYYNPAITTPQADDVAGIAAIYGGRNVVVANQVLVGTPGADNLVGGAGNDTLDGGDGIALSAAQASIFRLYGATLGRAPDAGGFNTWVGKLNAGASLVGVASDLVGSAEFQSRYGALDNSAFVTLLYKNVLGRAPDASGLSSWLDQLNGGGSRAEVVVGFSESAEYRNRTAVPASAWATTVLDGAVYGQAFRLYGATLGRAPDQAGFIQWVDSLASGHGLAEVTTGFINSAEFQRAYGGMDDGQFVSTLYGNVLHRAPDAGGLAAWTGQLAAGASRESVVDGFSESVENQNATGAALNAFMRTGMANWADTLTGAAGNDILFGGRGSDTFQFSLAAPGADHVYGFESWDTLGFTGFGYRSAADAMSHMAQSGADVLFSDRGETIAFHDTALATVAAAAFKLA